MKRITIDPVDETGVVKATSIRYGVSAYGRTVAEAKQRLFLTVWAEKNNMLAYFWSEEVDIRPRV